MAASWRPPLWAELSLVGRRKVSWSALWLMLRPGVPCGLQLCGVLPESFRLFHQSLTLSRIACQVRLRLKQRALVAERLHAVLLGGHRGRLGLSPSSIASARPAASHIGPVSRQRH